MCSTDDWLGDADRVLASEDGPAIRAHFRGGRILDATVAALRSEARPAGMPDLDDADQVLLAGSSAGGNGARMNADRLLADLRSTNPDLEAALVVDSAVKPIAPFEDEAAHAIAADAGYGATGGRSRYDASCTALHPDEPWWCGSPDHVLRNHVTTPMFVRQALNEKRPDDVTALDWHVATLEKLDALGRLADLAEEGGAIGVRAGWFGPDSDQHTALQVDDRFFGVDPDEQVTVDGWPLSLHDALLAWLAGEEVGWAASDPARPGLPPE
jgi:hypothetical protein